MNWYRTNKQAQNYTGYADIPDVFNSYSEVLHLMASEEGFPKPFALDMLEEITGEIRNLIEDDPAKEAFGFLVLSRTWDEAEEWGRKEGLKRLNELNQDQLIRFSELCDVEAAFGYQIPDGEVENVLLDKGLGYDDESGEWFVETPEQTSPQQPAVPQSPEQSPQF